MFTGTISENRITIGLQPKIREALYQEARSEGVTLQEFMRGVLKTWYEQRDLMRLGRGH